MDQPLLITVDLPSRARDIDEVKLWFRIFSPLLERVCDIVQLE
jgi:hypothetical protein